MTKSVCPTQVSGCSIQLEIRVMVRLAAWVERRSAVRTLKVTAEVGCDAQDHTTDPTEHRRLVVLVKRPGLWWMLGQCRMAVITGVPLVTTLHPQRDDVEAVRHSLFVGNSSRSEAMLEGAFSVR